MPQDSDPHEGLASPVFSSESSTDSSTHEHNNFEPESSQEINADNREVNLLRNILVEQGFSLNEERQEAENAANVLLDISRVLSSNPDQPMEDGQGAVDGPVQDMDQPEPPQENISNARRRLFPSKESDNLSRMHSLALLQTDHLLSKLPDQDDPPGRLPVSIVLPRSEVDQHGESTQSNLQTRRAMIKYFGSDEIPSEFRRQDPRNADLPTMPLCEEGIRKALQEATRHVAFFAKTLKRQLQGSETGITDSDYSLVFGSFRDDEFGPFRRLVRFAVRSLKDKLAAGPAMVDALSERLGEVEEAFAKLEFAFLCHKVHSMKRRFADTKTKINKVHMAVWSVYK